MPWCTGIGAVGAQPWLARLKDWETVGDKVTVKQTRIEQRSGGALAQGTTGLDGGGRLAGRLRVTTTPANFERLAQSLLGEDRRAKAVQALARAGRTDPQVEAEWRRQLAQAEQDARELRAQAHRGPCEGRDEVVAVRHDGRGRAIRVPAGR